MIPLVLTFLCVIARPLVADQQPGDEAFEVSQMRRSFQSHVEKLAAKTTALRSREMRVIAREFAARVLRGAQPSIPLRLLPTPVYRYSSQPKAGELTVVDGALFCFVQGTDPEIILMLEAVTDAEQQLVWRYSIGRMSRFKLEVEHQGELVKEFPWSPLDATRPYYVIKTTWGQTRARTRHSMRG